MSETKWERFERARYVGGYSKFEIEGSAQPGEKGVLVVTDHSIGLGFYSGDPMRAVLSFTEITAIEITARQVAKRNTGSVLAFGVLGGLAARAAKDETTLAISTTTGETAYYLIDDQSEAQVKARIVPRLKRGGVQLSDSGATPPADLADQLRQLTVLRDQGVLTPEQFEKAKDKLLG